jgi:hypothetical protein
LTAGVNPENSKIFSSFPRKILSRGILHLFGRPAKSKASGSSSFPRKFYQGTKIFSENNRK